jgi:hypothetical protein
MDGLRKSNKKIKGKKNRSHSSEILQILNETRQEKSPRKIKSGSDFEHLIVSAGLLLSFPSSISTTSGPELSLIHFASGPTGCCCYSRVSTRVQTPCISDREDLSLWSSTPSPLSVSRE